ncbi:M20/M25/M40 family metallo-hydrolase [Sphingomonas daechungensis]|uniref:M20/M25/M40 family metallo-hydrolase n=1 Tax=Sphingomonas daechungensis TaxID=1176646 RepID=UPI00378311C7
MFNTFRLKAEPLGKAPPALPVDAAAVDRLSRALQVQTVSTETGPASPEVFAAFHAFLAQSFPRIHAELQKEVLPGGSLLFTWPGIDPSAPALLLMAHQDVVPVEAGSEGEWSAPPFSGTVANGFVIGRGAIDDKGSLMAILEATERLLARGYSPRQTIYLAFGHDEERGGEGAKAMAALLKQRGANIGLGLDEGYAVLDGVMGGVNVPIAMIGIGEKGYVSAELTATGAGGHSSMPADDNSAVRIARAVERLATHQMPARIDGASGAMLDGIAPYGSFTMRAALANRWLTGPLVKRQLLSVPSTAAAIRTTTAPTILNAGTKDNVIPQVAHAVVNHRILPGDTVESVLEHDRKVVDDPQVQVRPASFQQQPGKPVSPDSAEYRQFRALVRSSFPEAGVSPGLVVGATDGRHYHDVAKAVLRFVPITMRKGDLTRFHGNDERIAIADYMRAIAFYERLMSGSPPPNN